MQYVWRYAGAPPAVIYYDWERFLQPCPLLLLFDSSLDRPHQNFDLRTIKRRSPRISPPFLLASRHWIVACSFLAPSHINLVFFKCLSCKWCLEGWHSLAVDRHIYLNTVVWRLQEPFQWAPLQLAEKFVRNVRYSGNFWVVPLVYCDSSADHRALSIIGKALSQGLRQSTVMQLAGLVTLVTDIIPTS